jgi:ATP-binding protein involved in chromosome partitioning
MRMTSETGALNGATASWGRDRHREVHENAPEPVPGAGEIVLIASGKGGVGKSTIAVNLACTLQRFGLKVGLLDADIFGPSVAGLLGTGEGLAVGEDGRAVPNECHGVHSVSVANVLAPEAAIPWKGPLVAQAVVQLFHDVAWPDLDVLVVDLPPGTGDVQLTILEQIPIVGAVVVTTPQRLSTADAERGIALFHEHDIPVFGVVRNMGEYICPCCGERQPLFEAGPTAAVARDAHVADLGDIPFDPGASALAEAGRPLITAEPQGPLAKAFIDLGRQVMAAIAREQRARARRLNEADGQKAFWERLLDD